MRAIFLLLLAALPLPAFASANLPPECLYPRNANVVIEPVFNAVAIDDRKNLLEIYQLSQSGDGGRSDEVPRFNRGHIPVGLAMAKFATQMNYEITMVQNLRGQSCAQINSLKVEVGFRNSTIFIAKELPRRSCSYREVLSHEQRHVDTDREFLRQALPRVDQVMRAAVRNIGIIKANSRMEAENQINKAMDKYLAKLVEDMTAEREILQKNIDTPAEYRRISASCDGQIGTVLRQRYGDNWLDGLGRRQ